MPTYEYLCLANNREVEVIHGIHDQPKTWGALCQLTGMPLGDIPPDSAIQKQVCAPSLAFPKTTAELKNLGFTKLVKRDKGVYENVTAVDNESRYMNADDPSTMPNLKKKISD